MTVTLQFHGAAGTVTGSCYRIIHPKGQFLIDCGLFQGNKSVRDLNLKPLPNVRLQPEIRFDNTSYKGAFDGQENRFMIGMGASYLF